MIPQWFNISDIPFKDMWPDDIFWFPHMLDGLMFRGFFLLDGHDILEHRLEIVDALP